MHEVFSKRPHPETIVLDIGEGTGALIIYTRPELHGDEIEVSLRASGPNGKRVHTDVLERRIGNQPAFTAVFASLPEGDYKIWAFDPSSVDEVTIRSGEVAEVDWR